MANPLNNRSQRNKDALEARVHAAKEMGFFERELSKFVASMPLKSKHRKTRGVPGNGLPKRAIKGRPRGR